MIKLKKIQYIYKEMDDAPFIKDDSGWYICGCGHSTVLSKIEEHMSIDFKGFCKNGIRKGKTSPYQCICGADFCEWERSEKHVIDKDDKCMLNALKYKNRSCEVCDIEFRGEAELKIHKKTKTHIEKENGTYKDIPLYCKVCDIKCLSRALMETHLKTKKHISLSEFPAVDLECKACNIKCRGQKEMRKHLETKKHKKHNGA